ncbi:hypothetical protein T492DRAFT_1124649 [Pavlovales sp. CCMP2436]|nr:hypothetical protein T492DRAFT_1124649 [Pavlovales sp. CCMP2436]
MYQPRSSESAQLGRCVWLEGVAVASLASNELPVDELVTAVCDSGADADRHATPMRLVVLLAAASASAADRYGRLLSFEGVQRLEHLRPPRAPEEVSCVPRPEPLDARTLMIFSSSSRTAYRAINLANVLRSWLRTYQRAHLGYRNNTFKPPPRVPPPKGFTLSVSVCAIMLENRSHSFRSFWGVPWLKMSPLCIPFSSTQRMNEWVNEMEAGIVCRRNWFAVRALELTGVGGGCGTQSVLPAWSGPAPAVIDYDDALTERCAYHSGHPRADPLPVAPFEQGAHKRSCIG